MDLQIVNLKNVPQHINCVSQMIYDEFVLNTSSTMTLTDIIEFFSVSSEGNFPITLVAVLDDKCVGTVSIFVNDYKQRPQYTPWLASLFVDEKYRGHGIAQQLITSVLTILKEKGIKQVYLKTESAGEYYQKRGWILIEKIDNHKELIEIYKYNLE